MVVNDQTTMHDAGMWMSKANPVQIGKFLLEDGKELKLSRKSSPSLFGKSLFEAFLKLQMYNEKSRHLGVRHNMIRELITNEVVSIEFVRSQQNLADHLTKGLARDLIIKSVEGMGLKSNQVAE
ncbi:hypothetical protein Tco_0566029 [Tanacetum coccineum]